MNRRQFDLISWAVTGAILAGTTVIGIGCNKGEAPPAASIEATSTSASTETIAATKVAASAVPTTPKKKPIVDPVVLVHTSAGDFKMQLFLEKAPQTVENFLRNYVHKGFYDETIVHHVEPESMVIAGGFGTDLQPRETRSPIFNESSNGLSNVRGTVAMSRDPNFEDSATSQFFINVTDHPGFDYQDSEGGPVDGYCVFGKVIEGMEVVDRISQSSLSSAGQFAQIPDPAVVIHTIEQVR